MRMTLIVRALAVIALLSSSLNVLSAAEKLSWRVVGGAVLIVLGVVLLSA